MKKIIALLLAFCLTIGIFAGCSTQDEGKETTAKVETTAPVQTEPQVEAIASAPKYVFLFIGEEFGMVDSASASYRSTAKIPTTCACGWDRFFMVPLPVPG